MLYPRIMLHSSECNFQKSLIVHLNNQLCYYPLSIRPAHTLRDTRTYISDEISLFCGNSLFDITAGSLFITYFHASLFYLFYNRLDILERPFFIYIHMVGVLNDYLAFVEGCFALASSSPLFFAIGLNKHCNPSLWARFAVVCPIDR